MIPFWRVLRHSPGKPMKAMLKQHQHISHGEIKMSSEKTKAKLRALKEVFSEYIAYTMLYFASVILLFVLALLLGHNTKEDAFGIKIMLSIPCLILVVSSFVEYRQKARLYCDKCDCNDYLWRD